MKDKTIFKKWWFWVIVVIVLGIIGALTQPNGNNNTNTTNTNNSQQTGSSNATGTLPKLNADEYKGKEGLVVYKDLKAKGYTVDAEFDKPALTDMNGKASSVFEPLDPNKADDRQSVDTFVVGDLTQEGDIVKLTIAHQPTN